MEHFNNIESSPESNRRFQLASRAINSIISGGVMGVERIILFGSTVHGKARQESDVDLALVISGNRMMDLDLNGKNIEIERVLWRAGIRKGSWPMGVHVTCWWDFEYQGTKKMHESGEDISNAAAMGKIVSEGLVLYQGLPLKP